MTLIEVVKADMRGSFQSVKVCAEALMRFHGLCRSTGLPVLLSILQECAFAGDTVGCW